MSDRRILHELEEIEDLERDELAIALANYRNIIRIGRMLKQLGDLIMPELEDAQAAVAKVQADVANIQAVVADSQTKIDALQQQVADLQAQIDAGGDPTTLKAGLAQIATDLTAVDAQLDTIAPDPVP